MKTLRSEEQTKLRSAQQAERKEIKVRKGFVSVQFKLGVTWDYDLPCSLRRVVQPPNSFTTGRNSIGLFSAVVPAVVPTKKRTVWCGHTVACTSP